MGSTLLNILEILGAGGAFTALSTFLTARMSRGQQAKADPNGTRQRLIDENTDLKIENARLRTDNEWLRQGDHR